MIKYKHEDWVSFKTYYGFTNQDIADLLGLDYNSVKNQTAKSKPLPKWAQAMIFGADLTFAYAKERVSLHHEPYMRKNRPDYETLKGFIKK